MKTSFPWLAYRLHWEELPAALGQCEGIAFPRVGAGVSQLGMMSPQSACQDSGTSTQPQVDCKEGVLFLYVSLYGFNCIYSYAVIFLFEIIIIMYRFLFQWHYNIRQLIINMNINSLQMGPNEVINVLKKNLMSQLEIVYVSLK